MKAYPLVPQGVERREMTKQWRPKGWENPYGKIVEAIVGKEKIKFPFVKSADFDSKEIIAYEAGADAILDAIKSAPVWVNTNKKTNNIYIAPSIIDATWLKGMIFIIPDKKE